MPEKTRVTLLKWIIVAYAGLVGLWWVFRAGLPGGYWWVWVINEMAVYFLVIPPLLLASAALLARQRRLVSWLVIPLVVFLVLFGAQWRPNGRRGPEPAGRPVRVMTYNILNRNADYPATAELITTQAPDLVGLQELVLHNSQGIQPRLAREGFTFHTPLPAPTQAGGSKRNFDAGLFSRHPLDGYEKLHLPWRDLSWQALVDIEGVQVRVLVLHLIPSVVQEVPVWEWPGRITEREALRMKQVDRALEIIAASREPLVVLCDCNFSETSRAYARFDAVLDDSFREVGWGLGGTIQPLGPLLGLRLGLKRIDYVWHSPQFVARQAAVVRAGPSDHFPVVVDLLLIE